jgi:hypothetical protein
VLISVRDYIGFCLGLAAIAFWLVAQVGLADILGLTDTARRVLPIHAGCPMSSVQHTRVKGVVDVNFQPPADVLGDLLVLAVVQLPQYYRNYKTKSSEALSPWFLAQWLLVSLGPTQQPFSYGQAVTAPL